MTNWFVTIFDFFKYLRLVSAQENFKCLGTLLLMYERE